MDVAIVVLHHRFTKALLSCRIPDLHLYRLPLDLHCLLPEIHADGGLGFVREAAASEAESEAGLAHVGVPDDDDLENAGLDAEVQGGAEGGRRARAGSAATAPGEVHGRRQDGHVVLHSVSPRDASGPSRARGRGLLLRGIVGHDAGGGEARGGCGTGERLGGWM